MPVEISPPVEPEVRLVNLKPGQFIKVQNKVYLVCCKDIEGYGTKKAYFVNIKIGNLFDFESMERHIKRYGNNEIKILGEGTTLSFTIGNRS